MFFVAGIGALALSAIYLTANASLLSKTYEKEDDLKYSSEAALAIGKAELNFNPAALPGSSYVQLFTNMTLKTADNQTVPGITVNLWVGPTGSTSGQFGRFASVVAQAVDANGTGFVRRLELTQESFAKYAYWTNSEKNGGTTIYFANGDQLWGPVWSNDTIHINTTGATFHDLVGTAKVISGTSYGTFSKGYQIHQKVISLPSLSSLSSLSALATASGFNFAAPTSGDETTVRMRIEFVASDMATPTAGDSTDLSDGFFRVYTANSGQTAWLRGDWPSSPFTATNMTNCGDWHYAKGDSTEKRFFPFSTHYHSSSSNTWFDTVTAADHGGSISAARAEADSVKSSQSAFSKLMQNHTIRCYLGGDPHLVAVSRDTSTFGNTQKHIGGDDTTFTATDRFGHWTLYSATPNSTIATKRPADAKYLFPLYRGFNTNTKGVIYVGGTVGISGVVGGDLTLYTPNTIVVLGDTRYASDPALGHCVDILGLISGANTVVADNAINTPQNVASSGSAKYKSLDATPDFYLHAIVMALGTSFEVENYDTGPTNALTCQSSGDGRGCLYLTGGIIQNNRGAVGTSTGTGYVKRYSYDACAIQNPPPYFPTTGEFEDNRYYELDPVRFNVTNLYKSLTPH